MKEFTNFAREVARKRNGFIPIKIVPAHAKLQERMRYLRVWCTEFDRVDDGDTRRDVPLRDITNKRRGDRRMKEEKVSSGSFVLDF
jgi:hypothetical protein